MKKAKIQFGGYEYEVRKIAGGTFKIKPIPEYDLCTYDLAFELILEYELKLEELARKIFDSVLIEEIEL